MTIEEITQHLGAALEECVQRGMQPPLIVCSISPNGSVLCMRVRDDGSDPEVLAEHYGGGTFQLPITIAVVDQTGEAARISITADKPLAFH